MMIISGVAVQCGISFVSFSSEDVQNLVVDKKTINAEFNGLSTKKTALHKTVFPFSFFTHFTPILMFRVSL